MVMSCRQPDGGRGVVGRDRAVPLYVPAGRIRRWSPPRPYFHPVRTLGGDVVSLYRPHDHVWHKGIALSLPNVGNRELLGRSHVQGRRLHPAPRTTGRCCTRISRAPTARTTWCGSDERLTWIDRVRGDADHRASRGCRDRMARRRGVGAGVPDHADQRQRRGDPHRQPDDRGQAGRRLRRLVLARPALVHRGPRGDGGRRRGRRTDGPPRSLAGVRWAARRAWALRRRWSSPTRGVTSATPASGSSAARPSLPVPGTVLRHGVPLR